jgi:BatD DUF11 like domain
MSSSKRLWSGLALVAWLVSGAADAAVRARVNNTNVAPDGTILLTLEHDGSTNEEPDLAPLKPDFDVLSSSSSSNMQIINGSVSSHASRLLSLAPKHSGELRIPPISWGGEQSAPLTVHVGTAPSNAQTPTSRTVFVETSAEAEHPYVQAQVTVTVRIYSQVPLYHASLELPSSNDILVQQIGADRNDVVVKDGARYQVVERRYAVFPQRSGSLTVPGPVLTAQIPVRDRSPLGDQFDDAFGNLRSLNNMFTSLRPIKEHGEDLSLNVLPRPSGALGDYWLPARDVKLGAEWHPDAAQVNAGDPVTLHLHLQAQGLTAAQLPDLSSLLQLPPGVHAYPDQAKLANDAHEDALLGERDQNIALIADRPGQFKVPALTIHWWDVQGNQPRETTLPERVLSVLPSAAAPAAEQGRVANAPVAQAPAAAGSVPAGGEGIGAGGVLWRSISVVLGTLWVLTLVAWYLTRRRKAARPTEPSPLASEEQRVSISQARRDFHDACRRNDARSARAALVRWIARSQPDRGSVGLRAFAKQTQDTELSELLADLDRACYANGSWSGGRLLAALQDLPLRFSQEHKTSESLAPLYR